MGDEQAVKIGDHLGPYRLVRELGRGATATVFEAIHEELSRHVAIKVLRAELLENEAAQARFAREGRAAARVHHPHVVEVFDVGVSPQPYLVMELVTEGTLTSHLQAVGALSAEAACALFLPVVSALQHIHTAGIVHRDLKPSNVLLRHDLRGRLHPMVADFGISKVDAPDARGEPLTREHAILGTLAYMAPEQLRSAATVEASADRWAVGVMLLEAQTGRSAFTGETTVQLMRAVLEDEPEGLDAVPEAMARILRRLLAKSPAERFSSDAELGLALCESCSAGEEWAASFGLPTLAVPGGTLDEPHREPPVPRRGLAGVGAVLVVLLLVVALGASKLRPASLTPTPSTTPVAPTQEVVVANSMTIAASRPAEVDAAILVEPTKPSAHPTPPPATKASATVVPSTSQSGSASVASPTTIPTGAFGAPILE